MAHVQHERLSTLTQSNEQRLDAVRTTLEQRLETLAQRQRAETRADAGDGRREAARRRWNSASGNRSSWYPTGSSRSTAGLGEMQSLATGVGDLKKVLTNVKTRGTWGEVQLENLLEQILVPSQYDKNVVTRPGSNERVEFAIRLPGRDADGAPCLLPIDAKFPLTDYQHAGRRAGTGRPGRGRAALQGARAKDQGPGGGHSRQVRRTSVHDGFRAPLSARRRASTPRCCGARGWPTRSSATIGSTSPVRPRLRRC